MLTKVEVLKLVYEAQLSEVSNDYIVQILRNFDDKESISKEKLEEIYKIVKAEEQVNINFSGGCDEAIEAWEELVKEL